MNGKKQPQESRSQALSRERLRRRYRPSRVRILFVGEAPPASGRFFYQADSGLYRALRDTFVHAFPDLEGADFLRSFQNHGCYLVDLCGKPVDRLDAKNRKLVCTSREVHLSQVIRQFRPVAIVTLVRSITANVQNAQQRAKWTGKHLELPYPGRWWHHRIEFDRKLVRFLRKLESH